MWKKLTLFALVFTLMAGSVALAANEMGRTPVLMAQEGLGFRARLLGEGRQMAGAIHPGGKSRFNQRSVEDRLQELEQLQANDPEAFTQKLLERHDQMVAKAEQIIKDKATLPQDIVKRLEEKQAEALKAAEEAAKNAEDKELAKKRLDALKAKQELRLAQVKKNADELASRMITRAEELLRTAKDDRAKIEAGQGLELIKERMEQKRQECERMPEAAKRRNR